MYGGGLPRSSGFRALCIGRADELELACGGPGMTVVCSRSPTL